MNLGMKSNRGDVYIMSDESRLFDQTYDSDGTLGRG